MAILEWSDELSVHVEKIDDQHKKLVALLNQLHDAMKEGLGSVMLGEILEALVTYTKTHFKDEEQLLQDNGYPELKEHTDEHEKLIRQVLELQKTQAGGCLLTLTVIRFLKEWVVDHIQGMDKKYSGFLHEKGIS